MLIQHTNRHIMLKNTRTVKKMKAPTFLLVSYLDVLTGARDLRFLGNVSWAEILRNDLRRPYRSSRYWPSKFVLVRCIIVEYVSDVFNELLRCGMQAHG